MQMGESPTRKERGAANAAGGKGPFAATFQLVYDCDRKGLMLKLFYTICTSLLPLANLYILKILIDDVTLAIGTGHYDPSTLAVGIVAFCSITLLNRWLTTLSGVNNDVLTQRLTDYINGRIQEQSARLDMAYYDNPDFHDTFHRAQQEAAFRPIRILENFVAVLGSSISIVGVVAMLMVASWQTVLVMLLAVLPTFVVKLYKSRRIYRFRRETTQAVRRSSYYGALLTNRTYAKEMRAFGLAPHIRDLYVAQRRTLVEQLLSISRRLALFDAVTAVVEVLALACILLLLVKPAVAGVITVGTFVMLFEAFRRGQGYLSTLVNGVSGLYEHKLFINNLFEFLSLRPAIVSPAEPTPFPQVVERVDFDDITFAYPDMSHPVLSHFNLSAVKGEITPLRGENGFGKTTLLKLLLRLYDPQGGVVRINGIDIRRFDVGELRRQISALFQDYVQFQFTARENIAFGDINHADDARRMAEALRLADAQPVVDSLGKGIDTQLGRQFAGGEELSMGQWQRIALARQLYSTAPILVFDEPTAWMDAAARRQFRETLEEIKENHIVLLVSHEEND